MENEVVKMKKETMAGKIWKGVKQNWVKGLTIVNTVAITAITTFLVKACGTAVDDGTPFVEIPETNEGLEVDAN